MVILLIMSAEKIIISAKENSINLSTPEINMKKSSGRVDINNLIARVRKEQKKENMTNIIFLGLVATVLLIVGIILSF